MYIIVEIQRGHLNQINLKHTPAIAAMLTIANKAYPQLPINEIIQNGAYEPAINTNIIEWSIFLSQAITLSEEITKWYTVEAVYKRIILIPKIITEAIANGVGITIDVLITNARSPIKDKIAPNKWVNPLPGSLT